MVTEYENMQTQDSKQEGGDHSLMKAPRELGVMLHWVVTSVLRFCNIVKENRQIKTTNVNIYVNRGWHSGTVCLLLMPHSEQVLTSNPSTVWGLSVWSLHILCLCGFAPQSEDMLVWLTGDSKLPVVVSASMNDCLVLYDRLAPLPGCTLFTLWEPG